MEFTYDVENFRDSFEHEMTWLNGFMRNVSRYWKKTALCRAETGETWTYQELNADANRLANAFLADGLKRNDVIMYMLVNSPDLVYCYLTGRKTNTIN